MEYFTTVRDDWEVCPGTMTNGPFATYKEAVWYGENEVKAAREMFEDGRANVAFTVMCR